MWLEKLWLGVAWTCCGSYGPCAWPPGPWCATSLRSSTFVVLWANPSCIFRQTRLCRLSHTGWLWGPSSRKSCCGSTTIRADAAAASTLISWFLCISVHHLANFPCFGCFVLHAWSKYVRLQNPTVKPTAYSKAYENYVRFVGTEAS